MILNFICFLFSLSLKIPGLKITGFAGKFCPEFRDVSTLQVLAVRGRLTWEVSWNFFERTTTNERERRSKDRLLRRLSVHTSYGPLRCPGPLESGKGLWDAGGERTG